MSLCGPCTSDICRACQPRHAAGHDQGRGVAEHGGRDHEGRRHEVRQEPVEQDRLAPPQEERQAVQGGTTVDIRLLHPKHLDGIWIGQDQYRMPIAPLGEYPEPWF